jgi:hypothetical protein
VKSEGVGLPALQIPATVLQCQVLTSPSPDVAIQFRAWHAKDERFGIPKGCLRSRIYLPCLYNGHTHIRCVDGTWRFTPDAPDAAAVDEGTFRKLRGSAVAEVVRDLYIMVLLDDLNEVLYLAECADLKVEVENFSRGIQIKMDGFHEKLPALAELFSQWVGSNVFTGEATPKRLAQLKRLVNSLRQTYANLHLDIGSFLRTEVDQQLLMGLEGLWWQWSTDVLDFLCERAEGADANCNALWNFLTRYMSDTSAGFWQGPVYIESLTFSPADAQPVIQHSRALRDAIISAAKIPVTECIEQKGVDWAVPVPNPQVRDLTSKEVMVARPYSLCLFQPQNGRPLSFRMARAQAPTDTNCMSEHFFQVGAEPSPFTEGLPTARTLRDALVALLSEPLFTALRTKQQLGYSVWARGTSMYGSLGINVGVESSSHSVAHLDRQITAFLHEFRDMLVTMCAHTAETGEQELGSIPLHTSGSKAGKVLRSLIRQKLAPCTSMTDEADVMWEEMQTRRFHLTRFQDEVAALRLITADSLLAFYDACILGRGDSDIPTAVLIVHIVGDSFSAASPTE